MRHIFKAKIIGWEEEEEGVWFDSDDYTKEEAEEEFKPYEGRTKDGFPYTGYEFDGQKYYEFKYMGEYPDDDMPHLKK